jgi:hypothetical protein
MNWKNLRGNMRVSFRKMWLCLRNHWENIAYGNQTQLKKRFYWPQNNRQRTEFP